MNDMTLGFKPSSADWPIVPRNIKLDWSNVPLNWIYNDRFSSHAVNGLSYFLISVEFTMCRLCSQALPLITDDKLRQDVKGFIKQEALHARAHELHLSEYMQRHGINKLMVSRLVDYTLKNIMTEQPFGRALPKGFQKRWLVLRAGFFAAAEHYTTGLAHYFFNEGKWIENGCDETMSSLMLWHSAEEIEHRTVMFDLYNHLGGDRVTRSILMSMLLPTFVLVLTGGIMGVNRLDPAVPNDQKNIWQRGFWKAWRKGAEAGNVTTLSWLIKHSFGFMREDYNPVNEGSTEQALAYLAQLPMVFQIADKKTEIVSA